MLFPAAPSRHGCGSIRPGDYYGECNQICGTNHSRMPIDVVALPDAQFQAWVAEAKKQFAGRCRAPAEH